MIGLFIGSFNPPTIAHLKICLKLKKIYQKIVFVPVNSKDKNLIDIKKRIDMLSIYTHHYSFLEIDDIMNNYSYLNYRILNILRDKYHNVQIIMGSDLLEKLDSFDNYQELLDNYSFTIITREGFNPRKIIKERYSDYQNKFNIINFNNNISSSIVRELLKENQDTSMVLDPKIFKYIKENDLY